MFYRVAAPWMNTSTSGKKVDTLVYPSIRVAAPTSLGLDTRTPRKTPTSNEDMRAYLYVSTHPDTRVTSLNADPSRWLIECPTRGALVSSGYLFARYSTMNPIGLSGFSMSSRSTIWMKRLQQPTHANERDERCHETQQSIHAALGLIIHCSSTVHSDLSLTATIPCVFHAQQTPSDAPVYVLGIQVLLQFRLDISSARVSHGYGLSLPWKAGTAGAEVHAGFTVLCCLRVMVSSTVRPRSDCGLWSRQRLQ